MNTYSDAHVVVNADNVNFLEYELQHDTLSLLKEVDLCYIDPPYNTGSQSFTYQDKQDTNEWLNGISDRLLLVKDFLKDTGVLIVSIDDNEVHTLRCLLDEVFGKRNFIAQLVIDGGNPKNNARFFSVSHEYMLVYAKNKKNLLNTDIKYRKKRDGVDEVFKKYSLLKKQYGEDYQKITDEMKEFLKSSDFSKRLKKFYHADKRGLYTYADLSTPGNSGKFYEILHPLTNKPCSIPSRGWGYNEDKMLSMIANDDIIFGATEKKQPMRKLYLKNEKDQVANAIMSYPARTTTHILESLLGRRSSFSHPKNLQLMEDIIELCSGDNATVLDFYAGSGTTGHAVLNLNKSIEESQRRFVLVTNNENNIFNEVCRPRIEAVMKDERVEFLTFCEDSLVKIEENHEGVEND